MPRSSGEPARCGARRVLLPILTLLGFTAYFLATRPPTDYGLDYGLSNVSSNLAAASTYYDLEYGLSIFSGNGAAALRGVKEYLTRPQVVFVETSGTGVLVARAACAVESAARAHPAWRVRVLFADLPGVAHHALHASATLRALAENYTNIRYSTIESREMAHGSPLEALVAAGGALSSSRYPAEHAADVLRFLLLLRAAATGRRTVYLDLDVLVRRALPAADWAARESGRWVSIGALAFSPSRVGRQVIEDIVREIQTTFRGDLYVYNGPGAITRVLARRCGTPRVSKMNAAACRGFEVYGPKLFYPIPWQQAARYFQANGSSLAAFPRAWTHHVWNRLTFALPLQRGSLYDRMARELCPTIYRSFLKELIATKNT